ncbi:hypothetical protein E3N88_09634 [Mikania micrantha]|uniref:Uncharacterized protein n=1 Tax=Mikania micrantha TaxID=192012 RepID=A0A5N6PKH1_9ASTR|nr:hypothetical protein E3N88_09634 [Mikania micrantha]
MNWDVDDDPCMFCRSKFHWIEDCPVFLRRYEAYQDCESDSIRRKGYMMENYKNDVDSFSCYLNYEPHSPSPQSYYQSNDGYYGYSYQHKYQSEVETKSCNLRQDWEYNNYELDIEPSLSYNEEYDYDYPHLAYKCTQDYDHESRSSNVKLGNLQRNSIMDALKDMKKENEVKDKTIGALLEKVGHLVEELTRIKALEMIVDNNTTNIPPFVEEVPLTLLIVDDKVENITNISEQYMRGVHQTVYITPLMSIMRKEIWTWHVNYRAFNGNSAGKCAFMPSCGYVTYTLIIRAKVWTRGINHRAYDGNSGGKCSIRPP